MPRSKPHNDIPTPNAGAVEQAYGALAEEYAKVRADAAEVAGNPATEEWEEVERELGRRDTGENR
jgi:hypothetical protein